MLLGVLKLSSYQKVILGDHNPSRLFHNSFYSVGKLTKRSPAKLGVNSVSGICQDSSFF